MPEMPSADAPSGAEPIRALRGRGAVANPQGRFEPLAREPFDDGWPADDDPAPPLGTRVSIEHARTIISRNHSPDIPFDLSLNPYRGCEHGCVYCYARPNHSYVGLSPGIDFETRLFAKTNAAQCLARELAAPSYRCEPINIGSSTDAYQPVEREFRITREVLQVLSDCAHPATIVTKSALIERDLDLLAPMARRGLLMVYVTVTTLDPVLARRWEPRAAAPWRRLETIRHPLVWVRAGWGDPPAAAPWRRLETIRRLSEAGIPVGVSVSPLAPFLNEPEMERILAEAAAAGASQAFYMILRLPWELKAVFVEWLAAHYPDRAQRVLNRLRDMRDPQGGARLNDPRFHARMKGRGNWAELVKLRFEMAARRHRLNARSLDLRTDLFTPPQRRARWSESGPEPAVVAPSSAMPASAAAARPASAGSQLALFGDPADAAGPGGDAR